MNYQFIIEQTVPKHRGWHFLVWIDEPAFRADCQRRNIASDYAHTSWPYDVNTWEGIIEEAAIDSVHDLIGITTLVGFAPGGMLSASNTPGPFQSPTAKHPGFELLLLNK